MNWFCKVLDIINLDIIQVTEFILLFMEMNQCTKHMCAERGVFTPNACFEYTTVKPLFGTPDHRNWESIIQKKEGNGGARFYCKTFFSIFWQLVFFFANILCLVYMRWDTIFDTPLSPRCKIILFLEMHQLLLSHNKF